MRIKSQCFKSVFIPFTLFNECSCNKHQLMSKEALMSPYKSLNNICLVRKTRLIMTDRQIGRMLAGDHFVIYTITSCK